MYKLYWINIQEIQKFQKMFLQACGQRKLSSPMSTLTSTAYEQRVHISDQVYYKCCRLPIYAFHLLTHPVRPSEQYMCSCRLSFRVILTGHGSPFQEQILLPQKRLITALKKLTTVCFLFHFLKLLIILTHAFSHINRQMWNTDDKSKWSNHPHNSSQHYGQFLSPVNSE